MSRIAKNQEGFSLLVVVAIILVLVVVGLVASRVLTHNKPRQTNNNSGQSTQVAQKSCPATPPSLQTPVDLSKVTSILYPGQYRGNEYKAHGGFRFDNSKPSDITVKAPLDGQIERASRYNEGGEVQILLEFSADCGYAYRFDHILKVAPALQSLVDGLPAPTDDSQTTRLNQPVKVKAGETIATAVGFTSTKNTFVDFGVYDNNHKNKAAQNPAFAAKFQSLPQNLYGVCWFDLLPAADAAKVKSLPAGDGQSGKTSDYCQ